MFTFLSRGVVCPKSRGHLQGQMLATEPQVKRIASKHKQAEVVLAFGTDEKQQKMSEDLTVLLGQRKVVVQKPSMGGSWNEMLGIVLRGDGGHRRVEYYDEEEERNQRLAREQEERMRKGRGRRV